MTIRTKDYFLNTSSGVLKDNTSGDIEPVHLRDAVDSLYTYSSPFYGEIVFPDAKSYTIDLSASSGYTVNDLITKTQSGTAATKLQINGVDVGGTSATSGTSLTTSTATTQNTVSTGQTLTLVVTGSPTAQGLAFKITRTPG